MYTMGVDIGSASSKVVILKDRELFSYDVVQLGTGTLGPSEVIENILNKTNLKLSDISYTVATGYGRFSFDKADKQISEISAHAKGIHSLIPSARTIIDIGGQDAKAIALNDKGSVKQFFMNDKCAAGTGRFLEVMARVLNVDLNEMQNLDKMSKNPATVSSTCTVFAESEVISQLSRGKTKEDIIKGVHNSVAHKISGLAYRTMLKGDIVMTGGVAKNKGVVRAISEELDKDIIVANNPQITGALGASIYAYEELTKED